jgi:hypothetical protein
MSQTVCPVKRKAMAEIRELTRQRIEYIQKFKKELSTKATPPRYDAVFFDGLERLNKG